MTSGEIKLGSKDHFYQWTHTQNETRRDVSRVHQSPQTLQNVVTYDIVISVNNSDLTLMPGMTAASQIVIDQRGET